MSQQPAAQSASELAGVIPKVTAVQNKARSRFLSLYRQEPQLDWRLSAGYRHEGSVTIVSVPDTCGCKPVVIVYDIDSISKVVGQFLFQLEQKGLHNPNGIYKAIGNVGKKTAAGIKIGSYWDEYVRQKQQLCDQQTDFGCHCI